MTQYLYFQKELKYEYLHGYVDSEVANQNNLNWYRDKVIGLPLNFPDKEYLFLDLTYGSNLHFTYFDALYPLTGNTEKLNILANLNITDHHNKMLLNEFLNIYPTFSSNIVE